MHSTISKLPRCKNKPIMPYCKVNKLNITCAHVFLHCQYDQTYTHIVCHGANFHERDKFSKLNHTSWLLITIFISIFILPFPNNHLKLHLCQDFMLMKKWWEFFSGIMKIWWHGNVALSGERMMPDLPIPSTTLESNQHDRLCTSLVIDTHQLSLHNGNLLVDLTSSLWSSLVHQTRETSNRLVSHTSLYHHFKLFDIIAKLFFFIGF